MSYQYPQGPWQHQAPPPYRPQAHGSATTALVLGILSFVFGPFVGVPAVLLARRVDAEIKAAPHMFAGGRSTSMVARGCAWVGSTLWLAFILRRSVIDTKAAAVTAIVLGSAVFAVLVTAVALPKFRPLLRAQRIALVVAICFVLIAPSIQFFAHRSTLSEQCDAQLAKSTEFMNGMNSPQKRAELPSAFVHLGKLLDEAERVCTEADRADGLAGVKAGRAEISRAEAKINEQAAAGEKKARDERGEMFLGEARSLVAGVPAKAAKGDWSGVTDDLATARAKVETCCRDTPSAEDAKKLGEEVDALTKRHQVQIDRITAARAKAQAKAEAEVEPEAAARARARSGRGTSGGDEVEANVRGALTDAELLVPRWVRDHMNDPDSYEYVDGIGTGTAKGPFWVITWTWKGANGRSTQTFCVSAGTAQSVIPCAK